MSFRAVWGKVRSTEQRLGVKLVTGVAGGPKHGGTTLTDKAKAFIKRFEEFDTKARKEVEKLADQLLDGAIDDLRNDN
jgi:molybdate transport system regulatory protein